MIFIVFRRQPLCLHNEYNTKVSANANKILQTSFDDLLFMIVKIFRFDAAYKNNFGGEHKVGLLTKLSCKRNGKKNENFFLHCLL